MHSVDGLKEALTAMMSVQNDPRFQDALRRDFDMQRAIKEGRTLKISIQDADDQNYWVHLNLVFGPNGQVFTIDQIEAPTALMWMNEETYNDIYEKRLTLTQAYWYSRVRWEGENWIFHAQLLMRFFNKLWQIMGI